MTKAQLRKRQLEAALAAVTEKPGITAYGVGLHVPVEQPEGLVTEVVANSAPATLVLSLLAELERDGKVYAVADRRGQRWHPAEESPDVSSRAVF